MKADITTERLEFERYSDVTIEHLHRYAIALAFSINKTVLDIASGEGYGSFLLSENAKRVYGVDIDVVAITKAKEKYQKKNLDFIRGEASNIPIDSNSIDVVVSFETIEHHDQHDEMFSEIVRVLKPNGLLIMSSPDKEYYSIKSSYTNKYHVKELYLRDFISLSKEYFKFTSFYAQKSYNFNSYISNIEDFNKIVLYRGTEKAIKEEKIEPLYNILLASNAEKVSISNSIFCGDTLRQLQTRILLTDQERKIKNLITFKIGNFILYPVKLIRNLLVK